MAANNANGTNQTDQRNQTNQPNGEEGRGEAVFPRFVFEFASFAARNNR